MPLLFQEISLRVCAAGQPLQDIEAGVLQDGVKTVEQMGTPQGATISPLLANIYLHYVFELWTEQWRRRQARGEVIIIRYADDMVLGFQYEGDARRYWKALAERLRRFGLELHPDKTRLLRFGLFAAKHRAERGQRKPETFEFLGFTHICGRSKAGRFLLIRRTSKKRMRATLPEIRHRLMRQRHLPIPVQGAWLERVIRRYFASHAVPTNIERLDAFRTEVTRAWLHALRRRSPGDGRLQSVRQGQGTRHLGGPADRLR